MHRRSRLGQEVLDDHLLHVAPAGVAGGDGGERLDAVGAALAEADQDAGREGVDFLCAYSWLYSLWCLRPKIRNEFKIFTLPNNQTNLL